MANFVYYSLPGIIYNSLINIGSGISPVYTIVLLIYINSGFVPVID